MGSRILVKDSYEMWKSLNSESVMIFADPLVCWECRDTLLLMRVQPKNRDTMLWIYSLTGSNEALYIHPRALELYMKARVCDPGPICCMVRYIYVSAARNYSKFRMKTPCNSGVMYQIYARLLSL